MTEPRHNLDWLAAHHAQQILEQTQALGEKPTDVDNTATKALGILQEDGIYACALFLKSRPKAERDRAEAVMNEMLNLLDGLGFGWGQPTGNTAEEVFHHLSDRVTCDSLERLLLAKETLEQMLIYTRYSAKAKKAEEDE